MTDKYIRASNNKGAVINTDKNELLAYKKRKAIAARDRQEMEDMRTEISELKNMVRQLMEMNNNGS